MTPKRRCHFLLIACSLSTAGLPALAAPPEQSTRDLLGEIASPNEDAAIAAARDVFVSEAAVLARQAEARGSDAILRWYVAGFSSAHDEVNRLASQALSWHAANRAQLTPEAARVVDDLRFTLLGQDPGLLAKEELSPQRLVLSDQEKCANEDLQHCLDILLRLAGLREQVSLRVDANGLQATALGGATVSISQAVMREGLHYTYSLGPQRGANVDVAVVVHAASEEGLDGDALVLTADLHLTRLIFGGGFNFIWKKPKPKPKPTTCCYYIDKSCAIKSWAAAGPCPENLGGSSSVDSTLCFQQPTTTGGCPPLTGSDLAICQQSWPGC